jgi:uncharacterized tellurite resistance protein B-like protein
MEYTFLPEKIRETLEQARPNRDYLSVLRGCGGLNGAPGESYLVAYCDVIYLFGKNFGDLVYTEKQISLGVDMPSATFKQDKFSSQLVLRVTNQEFLIKLSILEGKACAALLNKFNSPVVDTMGQAEAGGFYDTAKSEKLKPLAVLAACMKHLALLDQNLSPGEERLINAICVNEVGWINLANEYFKFFSFDELIQQTPLDHQQQLCFLANLYELAMVDGVLHTAEQRLIDRFIELQHLAQSESESIREVLLIKNQLSALT